MRAPHLPLHYDCYHYHQDGVCTVNGNGSRPSTSLWFVCLPSQAVCLCCAPLAVLTWVTYLPWSTFSSSHPQYRPCPSCTLLSMLTYLPWSTSASFPLPIQAVPLLHAPGSADLSAWVDFSSLRQAALESGARVGVAGPLPQGAFLAALGIERRTSQLMEAAGSDEAREALAAGVEVWDVGQAP